MKRENLDRLLHLDHLVRTFATGTPEQLAAKLGLSPSGWYRLRDVLVNDLDWPLAFDSYRSTYYYTKNVKFEIGFRKLDKEEISKISGGNSFFQNFTHSTFNGVEFHSFAFNLHYCRAKI